MSLNEQLTEIVSEAFAAVGIDRSFGEVVVAQRPELADYQCNGALAAAKADGRNPREIAEAVAGHIDAPLLVESVEIAGPGFLNFKVPGDAVARSVASMSGSPDLGIRKTVEPQTVVVDYGGPNMSKALHV